jgi:copper/silver efflux system protein
MKPAENRPQFDFITRVVKFCLEKKVVVLLATLLVAGWGIMVAPFDWPWAGSLRAPIPMDAIPDIGENQQIVFTTWQGRSPQDVEDQVTYPLTAHLLGLPGVRSVRSASQFGFSSIYLIFNDDIDFYWARSRIVEKLNSLPEQTLPDGVRPMLGPDATALGQVFWYTLEGRDEKGRITGGWDLNELRTVQDWYVRYALQSVEGVSEVASVGGFVQEYQIDLDPDRMRINGVSLFEVLTAVKDANRDVGARAIEVNRVEYLIRGMGFVRNVSDLENAVVKLRDRTPVFVRTVANVTLGPAFRQGVLDKGGAEAVGGVVVVRHGTNPLEVIERVKSKINEITPGLPRRQLTDGRQSQVRIIPFYDRTQLIGETLSTLQTALTHEVLVTIIIVVAMLAALDSAVIISVVLPLAVLATFLAMKLFNVQANIVALAGIAIAIGTMVDMGIIITEAVTRHRKESGHDVRTSILAAAQDVGGAVVTAVATTIVGFLPVFALSGAEGRLFKPLALTKTFALVAALIVAVCVIPPLLEWIKTVKRKGNGQSRQPWIWHEGLIYAGSVIGWVWDWRIGLIFALAGGYLLLRPRLRPPMDRWLAVSGRVVLLLALGAILAMQWMPLGALKGLLPNALFLFLLIGGLLAGFKLFHHYYIRILSWCLTHKTAFMVLPAAMLIAGVLVWQGTPRLLGWLPGELLQAAPMRWLSERFPGLGEEFMPPLDEGSYLLMPVTMPHAAIGEVMDILQKQDMAIGSLPEVETVVGKLGRADSALDPAPISMIETLVTYRSEYLTDDQGRVAKFRYDPEGKDLVRNQVGFALTAPDGKPYTVAGRYARDERNQLIPDRRGRPFRLWRPALDPDLNSGRSPWPGIQRADDIWAVIAEAAHIPGTTGASKLQPISARLVMLQSGIRANMGVKIKGPDQNAIEQVGRTIEQLLREVPSIAPETVVADRNIGKPYLEIHVDRYAIAQYGINLAQVLDVIEYAIGGRRVTTSVEGRERYPIRLRYMRELRDNLETIGQILVPAPDGTQLPLSQLARVHYVTGPQVVKGEDGFLVGYVLFDKAPGQAEVQVVEQARAYLEEMAAIGRLDLPAGVSFSFTGTYENQVRSAQRLAIILPLALLVIFVILYLQFNRISTSAMVFSGIAVAWSGGFILLWLYNQPWFLDFQVFDVSLRQAFNIGPVNLSVAVWVGFLALFGIASDDGVVMATRLKRAIEKQSRLSGVAQIRRVIIHASEQRVKPCLTTTATTVIALLPILSATGRGADLMVPMAIPCVGGMMVEVVTMLVVPVLFAATEERRSHSSDGPAEAI